MRPHGTRTGHADISVGVKFTSPAMVAVLRALASAAFAVAIEAIRGDLPAPSASR
jgi:hypothetical protein